MLVAAGAGERLGIDRPKAFAPLGGRPLLAESLDRLDRSPWVDAIVVAAPPGWEEPAILLAEELAATKVVSCVTGGATRADSVRAAFEDVPEDALVVLVHDAARPLLDDAVVERVLAPLAEGFDGVIPALPIPDTVKRVDGRHRRGDGRARRSRRCADAPGVPRASSQACVVRRSPGGDRLRLARRARRRARCGGRGRPATPQGDDGGGSGARRDAARVLVGRVACAHVGAQLSPFQCQAL